MIIEEMILNYINKNPYCRFSDLCTIYDGKRNDLVFALNKLIADGDVIIEDGTYILPSFLGLIKGKVISVKSHYAFINVDDENDVLVDEMNLMNALLGDIVYIHLVDKINFKVVKIIKRAHEFLVGEVTDDKRKVIVRGISTSNTTFNLEKEIDVAKDTIILVKITKYTEDTVYLDYVKTLGDKNAPSMDITRVLLENDCPIEFSDDVLAAMQKIPQKVSEEDIKDRLDLRNELIVTIDGDDSKDLDDAVSVKITKNGYEVGVHIADVSHYVKSGDVIDKEAYNRGTSIYVVDRVVPMLPFALSNGICSLNEHEDRLTLSCIVNLDKTGKVLSSKIVPSVINSKARLTYNYVNKVIESKSENNDIEIMIQLLYEVSKLLRAIKDKRGTLELSSEEIKIKVDDKGKPISITKVQQKEGEKLIEDLMILANEVVAKTISNRELPFIYRIHENPSGRKIDSLVYLLNRLGYRTSFNANNISPVALQSFLKTVKGTENEHIISMITLRSLAKARYSIFNKGHFGLASVNYTHFTSPIRRYPDLIVHRLVKEYIFGNKSQSKLANELNEIAENTSMKERRAIAVERETNDIKGAEYMEQFVGCQFKGYISAITSAGMFITLENGLSGRISFLTMNDYYIVDDLGQCCYGRRTGIRYQLGNQLNVLIDSVDKDHGDINLSLVENLRKMSVYHKRRRRR